MLLRTRKHERFRRCDTKLVSEIFLLLGRIDAFLKSDQSRSASRLLTAYNEGDIEEIKKVASSSTVSNLDHSVIHLNAV